MAEVRYRILGSLEVTRDGGTIALGGPRQRLLLALLLLKANDPAPTHEIADALWGGDPPGSVSHAIHVHVSNLRKALGSETIELSAAGYVLRPAPDALDAAVFDDLVGRARAELAAGHAEAAATLATEALKLWRGQPLDEFDPDALPRAHVARLEELWLAAVATRAEATLELGEHEAVVADLTATTSERPYDERLHALLMIALYRSGRPADALGVYETARKRLADDLGLEPSPVLREAQRRILTHDPALTLSPTSTRVVVVVPETPEMLPKLARLAAPLTGARFPHELILASLIAHARELEQASESARHVQEAIGADTVRAATFVSTDRAADILHLTERADVDLLVLHVGQGIAKGMFPAWLRTVLASAVCDVAFLTGQLDDAQRSEVVVPFGAREHDWAAVELGAWLASAAKRPLVLVGTEMHAGERDATRMLADAGLLVQRLAGADVQPRLIGPGAEPLAALATQGQLVIGLSDRWPDEGLGAIRRDVARLAPSPPLFVKRGFRAGGIASPLDLTRYRWSAGSP